VLGVDAGFVGHEALVNLESNLDGPVSHHVLLHVGNTVDRICALCLGSSERLTVDA